MYKVKQGLVSSNIVDIFSVKSSKYHLTNMDFIYPDLIVYVTGNILQGTLGHIYGMVYIGQQNQGHTHYTLQSFKSSIRCINLVDLISDNCGSCLICSS